jgi:hypothetical protein
MALHEVQISEGIIDLEIEVFMLRETLNFILQNADISHVEGFDEAKLRRQAIKHVKRKYPDEQISIGDHTD